MGIDFETVRKAALEFPGVEEGTAYGTPAFRVRGKFLGRLREDGELFALKVGEVEQQFLLEAEPEIYTLTEHYVGTGLVLIRLSAIDLPMFQDVFKAAWRKIAPKRDQAAYNAQR